MIELSTFGDYTVQSDGVILELPFKASVVLAVLAHAPRRSMPRSTLASWLWPNSNKAAHSLDQAVYVLRKYVGANTVRVDAGQVTLHLRIKSDYQHALDLIQQNDSFAACRLVTGRFLEHIILPDGDDFDDWRGERDAFLMSRLESGLLTFIATKQASEAWSEINSAAVEGLRLFPGSAGIRLAAVQSALAVGKKQEAVELYRDFRRMGADNGEVIPGIKELIAATPDTPPPPNPQLVARDREIATLNELLNEAMGGSARIAVLRGNPGVGKSTLAEAVCEIAKRKGWAIAAAKAHFAEQGIGYNLLAEILSQTRHLVSIPTLPVTFAEALAEILPDAADALRYSELPRLGQEAAQRRLLEAATHFVIQAALSRPLVILLDDIHWADDATLGWLLFFARRIREFRILVIATARDTPERSLVRELELLEGASILTLQEFNEAEVAAFVRSRGTDHIDASFVARLFQATRGNALLLGEYLDAAGRSNLNGPESGTDHPYLQRELNRLGKDARALLEAIAVFGQPVSSEMVLNLAGIPQSQFDRCWDEIAYFCDETEAGTLCLKHDLVQDTVYRLLTKSRRKRLHGRAAELLIVASAPAGVITEHLRKAGNSTDCCRFALEAAASSELAHAHREAAHFLEIAAETAASVRDRNQIRGRLAELLFRVGLFDAAVPLLKEQIELSFADPVGRLDWEWKHLRAIASANLAAFGALAQSATALEREAESLGHVQAFYQALYVQVLYGVFAAGSKAVPEAVERLLALARSHPMTEEGTGALRLAGQGLAMQVSAQAGLSSLIEATHWASRLKDPELEIVCLRTLGDGYYLVGELQHCRQTYNQALGLIERTGALLHKSSVEGALGCLLMELGEFDAAEQQLIRAQEADTKPESFIIATAFLNRAILAWMRADYSDALQKAEAALPLSAALSWVNQTAIAVRGLALLELGRTAAAAEAADYLQANLADPFVSDASVPCYFIARMAALRKRDKTVIGFIRKWLHDFRDRDYICRQRLQLALAEVLARSEPAEALTLCQTTIANCDSIGLVAVRQLAETVQRRVVRASRRV